MNTSDGIDELAAALAVAQGAMVGAKKDTVNPFYKSSYADLSSVVEAIKKPFADNGLSYVQGTDWDDNDNVVVVTRLMHSSGQWIESRLRMKPTKNDPQGVGSTITYARRYALQAIAGVPSEDDDGNAGSQTVQTRNNAAHGQPGQVRQQAPAQPSKAKAVAQDTRTTQQQVDDVANAKVSERSAVLEKIYAIRDAKKYNDNKILSYASTVLNRPLLSYDDLSDRDLGSVLEKMEAAIAAKA